MAVAGSSGGHGGAGSSGGHGSWSSGALASVLSARPYSRNFLYPPPPKFPGEVRGYQEPPGLKHQHDSYKTRQERPPGPDRQDGQGTAHRNQKPSWAGLEAEASSGH